MGVGTIKTRITRAVVALAAIAFAGSANSVTLDFEGFGSGQIIDEEYAPDVLISARNLSDGPDAGVIFDTTDSNPAGGDFDLIGPFDSNDPNLRDEYSTGNVLIIQERNDCDFGGGFCETPDDEGSRPGGEFEFLFSADIVLETIDFFDIEFEENDQDPNSEIHLYDGDGNEIQAGMFYVPDTGGDNMWNRVDFGSIVGVRRVVIELNGSGAIDNLSYQVVPVPATAWLFCSAIGLLGALRAGPRRKRLLQ